jgi:hypothetical protein
VNNNNDALSSHRCAQMEWECFKFNVGDVDVVHKFTGSQVYGSKCYGLDKEYFGCSRVVG